MIYTEKTANEILELCNARGWNVYQSIRGTGLSPDDAIRKVPLNDLDCDTSYVLLPAVQNPRDPRQVFDQLEALAVRLDREMPTISVFGKARPVTGFTLYRDEVKVHTPQGTWMDYADFLEALDTIVKV